MSSAIRIRKGYDVRVAGAPAPDTAEAPAGASVAVFPVEFERVRPRLLVKEGDSVRRGAPVACDRGNDAFRICAPAGGTVAKIVFGERRSLQEVRIDVSRNEEAEPYPRFAPGEIATTPRERILDVLLRSGYLARLVERPFSRIPDPAATPKSIFVNGMATAPFGADLHVAVRGQEAAFQAGLDALSRLTAGKVWLCLAGEAASPSPAVTGARNVEIRYFSGPHPSGNSSVHIHHLDPIAPGDRVWTVRGVDLLPIGELLLSGAFPTHRTIALGGPGLLPGAARHYRMRIGGQLGPLLHGRLAAGEPRVVSGDLLSGVAVDVDSHLRFGASAVNVVLEDRERHLVGWMMPGWKQYSRTPLYLSTFLRRGARWALGTNLHGGVRAMVATGLYDQALPMRIRSDFLVRAILAGEIEEAVKLGLLEVDPEDFALPAFLCPSKMDLVGIVRQGLRDVETEGF